MECWHFKQWTGLLGVVVLAHSLAYGSTQECTPAVFRKFIINVGDTPPPSLKQSVARLVFKTLYPPLRTFLMWGWAPAKPKPIPTLSPKFMHLILDTPTASLPDLIRLLATEGSQADLEEIYTFKTHSPFSDSELNERQQTLNRGKKIVLVSEGIAGGHRASDRAIFRQLMIQDPTASVTILDIEDFANTITQRWLQSWPYRVGRYPNLYHAIYEFWRTESFKQWSQEPNKAHALRKVGNHWLKHAFAPLLKKLQELSPDAILTLHPSATLALGYFRAAGLLPPTQTHQALLTDLDPHSLYQGTYFLDRTYVGSPHAADALKRTGVAPETITVSGMPIPRIKPHLKSPGEKQRQKQALGLDPHRPVIVLTAGSMGFGSVRQAFQELLAVESELTIVVITGRNQELKEALYTLAQEPHPHHVLMESFIPQEKFHAYTQVADLVITKGGGLSTYELLAQRTPFVIIPSIGSHELVNALVYENEGAALVVPHTWGSIATLRSGSLTHMVEDELAGHHLQHRIDSQESYWAATYPSNGAQFVAAQLLHTTPKPTDQARSIWFPAILFRAMHASETATLGTNTAFNRPGRDFALSHPEEISRQAAINFLSTLPLIDRATQTSWQTSKQVLDTLETLNQQVNQRLFVSDPGKRSRDFSWNNQAYTLSPENPAQVILSQATLQVRDLDSQLQNLADWVLTTLQNAQALSVDQKITFLTELYYALSRLKAFMDGNGRTNRLFLTLVSLKLGLPPPLFTQTMHEHVTQHYKPDLSQIKQLLMQAIDAGQAFHHRMEQGVFLPEDYAHLLLGSLGTTYPAWLSSRPPRIPPEVWIEVYFSIFGFQAHVNGSQIILSKDGHELTLGSYIGEGLNSITFKDASNPGRVIKLCFPTANKLFKHTDPQRGTIQWISMAAQKLQDAGLPVPFFEILEPLNALRTILVPGKTLPELRSAGLLSSSLRLELEFLINQINDALGTPMDTHEGNFIYIPYDTVLFKRGWVAIDF